MHEQGTRLGLHEFGLESPPDCVTARNATGWCAAERHSSYLLQKGVSFQELNGKKSATWEFS